MKGRKNRATGGLNQAKEDLASKPTRYDNAPNVENAAEERKRGGRAKRKDGGPVSGAATPVNAGRKARKSGGRAGCEGSPFSAARHGTPPSGHKVESEMESE